MRIKIEEQLKMFNKLEIFIIEGEWVSQMKINGVTKEGNGTSMERSLDSLENELNSVDIRPRKK